MAAGGATRRSGLAPNPPGFVGGTAKPDHIEADIRRISVLVGGAQTIRVLPQPPPLITYQPGCPENRDVVHSQTLPAMSCRPYGKSRRETIRRERLYEIHRCHPPRSSRRRRNSPGVPEVGRIGRVRYCPRRSAARRRPGRQIPIRARSAGAGHATRNSPLRRARRPEPPDDPRGRRSTRPARWGGASRRR